MKKKHLISFIIIILLVLVIVLLNSYQISESKPRKSSKLKDTEIAIEIIEEKPPVPKETPHPQKKKDLKETPAKDIADASNKNKESEEEIRGELPSISANYRSRVGFKKYEESLSGLGAIFLIINKQNGVIYRINFKERSLRKISVKNLTAGNFSSRSRVITDEPALDYYTNYAKKNFKVRESEVILLVPKKLENHLYEVLKNVNLPLNNISVLKGYYYINPSQQLSLKLNKALLNDRKIQKINIDVNF